MMEGEEQGVEERAGEEEWMPHLDGDVVIHRVVGGREDKEQEPVEAETKVVDMEILLGLVRSSASPVV